MLCFIYNMGDFNTLAVKILQKPQSSKKERLRRAWLDYHQAVRDGRVEDAQNLKNQIEGMKS